MNVFLKGKKEIRVLLFTALIVGIRSLRMSGSKHGGKPKNPGKGKGGTKGTRGGKEGGKTSRRMVSGG